VTKEQCRAARGLVGWTTTELAQQAEVARDSIVKFENDRSTPRRSTIKALRAAFESAGVQFLDNGQGPGVRLIRKPESTAGAEPEA
jgi:DNA-binding XRE family transcriptional regulator